MKNITEGKLIKTEFGFKLNDLDGVYVASVQTGSLSLENCQAIERGYDLQELAEIKHPISMLFDHHSKHRDKYDCNLEKRNAFIEGAKTILEILGDKKFTEDEMIKAIESTISSCSVKRVTNRYVPDELLDEVECALDAEDIIQELQQTEWDVEIDMELNLNGKNAIERSQYVPKRDSKGKMILKIKK